MARVKQQSLGKGFTILSISNISVKVLSLIFIPIIRQLMGSSTNYGINSVTAEVFALAYVITTAGIPVAIAKLVSELLSNKDERGAERAFKLARTVMFGIGLVVAVLMAVLAKPIANAMGSPKSWAGILFIAPTILVCSILSSYKGYFQGHKNMNPTAICQVIDQLSNMVVSIIMVAILIKVDIVWAVAGYSIGTVAGASVSLAYMVWKRNKSLAGEKYLHDDNVESGTVEDVMSPATEVRKKKPDTMALLKKIFYYSIPIVINTAIQYAGDLIDTSMILKRLQVAGLSLDTALGWKGDLYSTRQLLNVPTSIISAMCVSILPAMAALHVQKKIQEKSDKANEGHRLCYIIAVPMMAAFGVFSQPIFKLLGYGPNNILLSALCFSIILQGTVHLQSSILQSVNKLFTSTLFLLAGGVTKIVLSYILIAIPGIEIYGSVISTYASFLVPFLLNLWVLNKKEKLKISVIGNIWRPCLASVFMVMIGFPIYWLLHKISEGYFITLVAFVITAVVCVAVYFVAMIMIGGLTKEIVTDIAPKLGKFWPNKIKRIL